MPTEFIRPNPSANIDPLIHRNRPLAGVGKWFKYKINQAKGEVANYCPRITQSKSDVRKASIERYITNIDAHPATATDKAIVKEATESQNDKINAQYGGKVKKALSYFITAIIAGVESGHPAAVLAAPAIHSGVKALHAFSQGFTNRHKVDGQAWHEVVGNKLTTGLAAFSYSLAKDLHKLVFNDLNNLRKNPGKILQKHLLKQAYAPKTWGKIGAVIGGGVGAFVGGPLGAAIGAGIGWAVGRAVGHAIGWAASFSADNEGLTAWESLKRAGFVGLSDEQKERINNRLGEQVSDLLQLEDELEQLTDGAEINAKKAEISLKAEKIAEFTQLLRTNGSKEGALVLSLRAKDSTGEFNTGTFGISVTQLHQIAQETAKDADNALYLTPSLVEFNDDDDNSTLSSHSDHDDLSFDNRSKAEDSQLGDDDGFGEDIEIELGSTASQHKVEAEATPTAKLKRASDQ